MLYEKYIMNIKNISCTFCCTKYLQTLVEDLLHFSGRFSLHTNKIGIIFQWNRLCFGKLGTSKSLKYIEKVQQAHKRMDG